MKEGGAQSRLIIVIRRVSQIILGIIIISLALILSISITITVIAGKIIIVVVVTIVGTNRAKEEWELSTSANQC